MPAERTLTRLSAYIRRLIVESTTAAGSGHPSSSLSAVELMVGLFGGGVFRADPDRPAAPNNDRLIFSKGHAAPLLYALYAAAGRIPERRLLTLRTFGSPLEGHPMPPLRHGSGHGFPYVDVPTGSLGQGLSLGIGMALAAQADGLSFRTYVLLGDGEMSEGQVWEAIQFAGHRRLDHLTAVIDVNRLGQSGPTMLGHNVKAYATRLQSFNWRTIIVSGHDLPAVIRAYRQALRTTGRPTAIIAKTFKGRGVRLMENLPGWHGRVVPAAQLPAVVAGFDATFVPPMTIARPRRSVLRPTRPQPVPEPTYDRRETIAPHEAFGRALVRLAPKFPRLVVLDGDVKNSTKTEYFAAAHPHRFVQAYIAEQNMVSIATGLAARGFLPVASTFAAFLSRAGDQLRMANYAGYHQLFAGTHVGVSIGQDGPSQMGLEDIALFRALGATILYPADAWATERLLEQALRLSGLIYLRLTRQAVPSLYRPTTRFPIGGSQTLRHSPKDRVTIVAAGITVWEALRAADALATERLQVRVIDAYSVEPLDVRTLRRAAKQTKHLIVVEDHRPGGGLGEAVRSSLGPLAGTVNSLAVTKTPRSGRPAELLRFEHIDAAAIVRAVRKTLKR